MHDERLSELVELIRSHIRCDCIYLTGSRGVGTEREGSDYDLIAVTSLPSMFLSMRSLSSLAEKINKSIPTEVDLRFATPGSLGRARNSLHLIICSRKARLVYGAKDILKDLKVGYFAPEESSVVLGMCYKMKWLLGYVSVDPDKGVRIDHMGLSKFSRILEEDIHIGAGSVAGIKELDEIVRAEVAKGEMGDPYAVCRSCASFLQLMQEKVKRRSISPVLSFGINAALISRRRESLRRYAFTSAKTAQYRILGALTCLYQSSASNPPSLDLLRNASRLLAVPTTASQIRRGSQDLSYTMLWEQVKSIIRSDWEIVMNHPFGQLVLHEHPFDMILL